MDTVKKLVELFGKVGGYLCCFEVGSRTDAVFFSFSGRLQSANYTASGIQLHISQPGRKSLSYLLLDPAKCSVDGQSISVIDGSKRYRIHISQIAHSDKLPFRCNLEEENGPLVGLSCPACGKTCNSPSGLTLHRKKCETMA